MKRITVALACLTIPFLIESAVAGSPDPTTTLICSTQDGDIRITANRIMLRDYRFEIEDFTRPSVVRLYDARTDTFAELDARSDEGIYLTIQEPGLTMQLVAPRARMSLIEGTESSSPAMPAISQAASPAADMIALLKPGAAANAQ